MKIRNILKSKKGDTNFISIIIILVVFVIIALLFGPYISKLFEMLTALFK